MIQGEAVVAKEAAAKDNLRMLRGAIEFYAANHGDVAPGYAGGVSSGAISQANFLGQAIGDESCLREMPENPFNNLDTILMIGNAASFPTDATGQYGWVYQPITKTIRIDWPGGDQDGVRYFDY